MDAGLKHNINLGLPLIIASFVSYKYCYSKSGDVKNTAICFGIVFLLSWVIVASITKSIDKADKVNNSGTVPPDNTSYNPTMLATQLHNDINCIFCFRDYSLYDILIGLSDFEFVKVAQYYKQNFNASLSVDIANENSGIVHESLWNALKARFIKLNIN
jgi:hypothetical protein